MGKITITMYQIMIFVGITSMKNSISLRYSHLRNRYYMLGRRTYDLFKEYRPKAAEDPEITDSNRRIADLPNNMKKLCFQNTLQKVEEEKSWKNVRLLHRVDGEKLEN
jgi:hypothetical protein